ncbi:MAG: hypothetical protein H0Z34_14730 [Brevibacillus sp.]|nr:hypothetical protein [Brevibacillus sp.]
MEEENKKIPFEKETSAEMQAELPALGTALNPLESGWVFDKNAAAAPPEQLDSAMQQGE